MAIYPRRRLFSSIRLDGLVKSPSAALRFNFVVEAHLVGALHSSVFARLASGAFYETIVRVTFKRSSGLGTPFR